jgi:electron transfer flavoprotein alpha subunit
VANIIVYADTKRGRPSAAALGVLGVARGVASDWGAALYVLAFGDAEPSLRDEQLSAQLAQYGADKVVLLAGPEQERPDPFGQRGAALLAACERIPPALLYFADNAAGRELAPRIAARLGAAYLPGGRVAERDARPVAVRTLAGGLEERLLMLEEVERPVVLTVAAQPGSPRGSGEADEVRFTHASDSLAHAPVRVTTRAARTKPSDAAPPVRAAVVVAGARPAAAKLRTRLRKLGVLVLTERQAKDSPPGAVTVAVAPRADHPVFARARFGVVGAPGPVLTSLARTLERA